MRTRSDKGQATVLTLVFLVVLLGMAALVLDVGSWYRADRAVQSTADAAALAGAQSLPYNPGNASTLAVQYGDKNGGGVNGSGITISNSSLGVNDTITVHLTRPAPGVFTKLFGVNSVTVGAHATARASLMQQAQYIAPIGVNLKHPKLKGTVSCPCFGTGNPTTLPLGKTGAPGAFDLLNVDGSHGGTGPQTLADWILKGYSGYLPDRLVSLGSRGEVELQARRGRAHGPPQHESALPRLRRDRGQRCQRDLPRRRLGRIPPDRLRRQR